MKPPKTQKSLVLFDGVCNLCNAAVNFVIDHDAAGCFVFVPLQSPLGITVLRQHGLQELATLPSVVLVEDNRCYLRSTAALRIASQLDGLWLSRLGVVIPGPLRDALYDFVAANRYRWFGRRRECRVPTPELAARFQTQAVTPAAART